MTAQAHGANSAKPLFVDNCDGNVIGDAYSFPSLNEIESR